MDLNRNETILDNTISFLRSIGIPVHYQPIETSCFLPGISIEKGELLIDKEKLKYPGDILHEAGHIAVVPGSERNLLDEHSISGREHREAEEMAAIAWSYAACVHLGLDAEFVFHEGGYKDGGKNIADNFREGRYFGVPMLEWFGMCGKEYPVMRNWLR